MKSGCEHIRLGEKYMKIDRLLAIVMVLMNRESINARELAERFEVSRRTIQRDMETLECAGIPIISYQGKDGGYGIMPQYRIGASYLSKEQWSLLFASLDGVSGVYNEKTMLELKEKLSSIHRGHLLTESEPMILDFKAYGYDESISKSIETIKRAIERKNVLRIEYHNLKGEAIERCIEPMKLILKVNQWYVAAYCRVRKAQRIFKLSRIRDIQETVYYFDPKPIVIEKLFGQNDVKEVNLHLMFDAIDYGRITSFFPIKCIEFLEGGKIEVKVKYPEDEWIYSMLMGFGDKVDIIKPKRIKKIVAERLMIGANHHKEEQ
jgi:predicted DNA-binding transcriptional regulator YafY